MDKILICLLIKDTQQIYYLPEERVSATYENFSKEWDLSSIIRPGYYSSLPIPFGSFTRMLYMIGGVGPSNYGFSVRGGAFWENRVIINGIPLLDPIFHLIIMAPVEQEVVNYAILHRGALPIDYQGTSSILEIQTKKSYRYLKAGFPSASAQIASGGTFVYSYGEWIPMNDYFSASLMAGSGPLNAIAYIKGLSTLIQAPQDTIVLHLTQAQTGFSFEPTDNLRAAIDIHSLSIQDKKTGEMADGYMGLMNIDWKWQSGGCQAEVLRRWGVVSDIMPAFTRKGYIMGCYLGRRSGIRLDIINNRVNLSIRLFRKLFINEKTALKLYLGNGHQIVYIYPLLLEPFILRRATTVYTAISGIEWLSERGYTDINLYLKYYAPYTAGDSISRRSVVGMDFTIVHKQNQISGFLQRGNIPGTARWIITFFHFDRQGRGGILMGMRDGILFEEGKRGRAVGFAGFSRTFHIRGLITTTGFVYYMKLPIPRGGIYYDQDVSFLLPILWFRVYF